MEGVIERVGHPTLFFAGIVSLVRLYRQNINKADRGDRENRENKENKEFRELRELRERLSLNSLIYTSISALFLVRSTKICQQVEIALEGGVLSVHLLSGQ